MQIFRTRSTLFTRAFSSLSSTNTGLYDFNFTTDMKFQDSAEKLKCFRVIDENGRLINDKKYVDAIPKEKLIKMYQTMVLNAEADVIFDKAQKQNRISFYMTSKGEEGQSVASCAALKDIDVIFPQYREVGVFLWRGFTIGQMADQLTGNHRDWGMGRQMPVHYGSNDMNIVTVSSPLATQIPQASGAGYKYRLNGDDRIAVTYFGDGSASEGDFHAALNFAATLRSQTLFFCRNNMWAISTPVDEQYAGDGIGARGLAYGIKTIRVDGNDVFAVYNAVQEARRFIVEEKRPALIEGISYRGGNHSTSDNAGLYRDDAEMAKLNRLLGKLNSPIDRLEKYLLSKGWIEADYAQKKAKELEQLVKEELKRASKEKLPPIDELFEDVYKDLPDNLKEQKEELYDHFKRYGQHYDLGKFKDWNQ